MARDPDGAARPTHRALRRHDHAARHPVRDPDHQQIEAPAQLARIEQTLTRHVDESNAWRAKAAEEITKNTEITEMVRSGVEAGKITTAAIKWVSGLAVAVASIWWAVKEFMGANGGGIGPTP